MLKKYNVLFQLKIIAVVLTAVVFLAFFWTWLVSALNNQKQTVIDLWNNRQITAVSYMIEHIRATNLDTSDHTAVNEFMTNYRYTELSYGFLYADNRVIHENNPELTKMYAGKTIREMYGAYSYSGGSHLLEVLDVMEDERGAIDYFIKNHFKGREWVTWLSFEYDSKTMLLGIATPESYILSRNDFTIFSSNAYAMATITTFLLVLYASLLCFYTYRNKKQIDHLTNDLMKKNEAIRILSNEVDNLDQKFKSLLIRDVLTGVYSRKFFDVFLGKLTSEMFLPLSVVLFDVNGLKLINNAFGYEAGDMILKDVVTCCEEVRREDDVLARYGNDEFILLMVNTPASEAFDKAKTVSSAVYQKYTDTYRINLSYGVSSRTSLENGLYDMVSDAEDHLNLDKLHIQGSVRSASISMLKKILSEKTNETGEHCMRIVKLATLLGEKIGMDKNRLDELAMLAYLHDIGKISIPDSILNKKYLLTTEEMEVMKTHSQLGYNIAMSSSDLKNIALPILQHHERWDGKGYPNGLSGEKITLEARIISIADAFDTITNKRVYKESRNISFALREIESCAGTQFDPDLTMKFIELISSSVAANQFDDF